MKRLVLMLMAATMMLSVNAQELTKEQAKSVRKEVSKKLKDYKKKGYEIFGSSRTLETVLTKHYTTLEAKDGKVVESGTHDELMNQSPIYREVYEQQTNGGENDAEE